MTATNSIEPAKDGSGTPFNITFAAESISGNKAQKTYLGEPVGETIITPAQDGTDGTGITPPTGGVGIRGWLSGIYNKVSGLGLDATLQLILTAVSSPIPAASPTSTIIGSLFNVSGTVSLPTGAATAANQLAPLTIGAATPATGTPPLLLQTLSAPPSYNTTSTVNPPYVDPAGNFVTGAGTFVNVNNNSMAVTAVLHNIGTVMGAGASGHGVQILKQGFAGVITTIAMSAQHAYASTTFKVYVFSLIPATTFTDAGTPAIVAGDVNNIVDVVILSATDSGLGTHSLWYKDGLNIPTNSTSIWLVPILTAGAITPVAGEFAMRVTGHY